MRIWQYLIRLLKGFLMGIADLIPGVSGGTMAWILNIYPELINAIRSFDQKWLIAVCRFDLPIILGRPHFGLLIPLSIGILSAFFFFTHIISLPRLIHTHPETVYGLFFGLVGGSIFSLLPTIGKFHLSHLVMLLSGLALGAFVFSIIPKETPESTGFIILCGTLSISAMLLPGLSGALILLLLKKYTYIFHAIGSLQFAIIIPFALGALIGLFAFSRLLGYLLTHYYRLLLAFIIGLLTASLWEIWPFQMPISPIEGGQSMLNTPYLPHTLSSEVGTTLLMAILGWIIIQLLQFFSRSSAANSTTPPTETPSAK